MAAFERFTTTGAAPARLALDPRAAAEPMQRALDRWYREQPKIFARSVEPPRSADPDGSARQDNMLGGAERAIALNHLLNYGRLAAERDLAGLHDRAAADSSPIRAPLLRQLETRNAELLARAPVELQPALGTGLAATRDALVRKAAAIDAATDGRRQATALEQSLALGEALLQQDPTQYETLIADAGTMLDGLGLEDGPRQALSASIHKRLADATLLAQMDPVAGDLDTAAADLERGRFRDAFDATEIATWREFVVANRARAAAEVARREQNAGIVAEIRMLNRLAAAVRADGPMPTPAEIERVFPGEGEARLQAARTTLKRRLYQEQRALQPFDQDAAWIEAGEEGEDRLLRAEVAADRQEQFAANGAGDSLSPALAKVIEEGVRDFSKLDVAIELYRRHLAKLRVPPEKRRLLPQQALAQLADQYEKIDPPQARLDWLDELATETDGIRAKAIVHALAQIRPSFDPNAIRALEALLDPEHRSTAINIIKRSERDQDFIDGFRLEVRLNPETAQYEEWEVSPQGRERKRPRRFAGAYFKVETRNDPITGTPYEVEVFTDGSERPRLPANKDYPSLSGMALETWRIAAYEQFVNPATWRLATPADEWVQEIYRERGVILPDRYFVGPNSIVYVRNELTEEPYSTSESRWREILENRSRQDAALEQAVTNRDFDDLLGVALGPSGLLVAGLGTKRFRRAYDLVPYRDSLRGLNGLNFRNHPGFAEYCRMDKEWTNFRNEARKGGEKIDLAKNAPWMRRVGALFQEAVTREFAARGYDVGPPRRLTDEEANTYAVPDGSATASDMLRGFIFEVKSTNTTAQKGPDLSFRQATVYASAAAQGRIVLVVFPRGDHLVVRRVQPRQD